MKRILYLLTVMLLLGVLSACSSMAPPHASSNYSRAQLLSGDLIDISHPQALAPVALLKVNDDMRRFLAQHVTEGASTERKAEQILRAILRDGLNLEYESFKTYTADEAYYKNTGNCLSFTALFIALAREAGIDAQFQQVDVPPNWAQQDGVYAFNLHINALINSRPVDKVVDFNLQDFDADYPRRAMSDEKATAQYHNNKAVEALSQNDFSTALLQLRTAISLDPKASYYWNNLGALYRRAGHVDAALASYQIALSISPEPIAMSNLARHFRKAGNADAAVFYENKIRYFRDKNPFYHYQLAKQSYAKTDYKSAQKQVRRAIKLDKYQHRFHRLMALVQLQHGDRESAKHSFERAAKLANEPKDRAVYARKLALLASASL